MSKVRRGRWLAAAAAVGFAVVTTGALSAVGVTSAGSDPAGPAFSATQTVTRTLEAADGSTSVVASNTVNLTVSQTQNLQGRQDVTVSWSGAHPTGGVATIQNTVNAQNEEYPVVLLQCRGGNSAADPVSPGTCWTQSWTERLQLSNASSKYGLYPPYRLDQYSSTHAAIVGRPATEPKPSTKSRSPTPTTDLPTTAQCQHIGVPITTVQYWVPWTAASGRVYAGGNAGACGQPPQATSGITSALPSNETFGVTGANGTGRAEFDVFTATDNTTLGCSSTVACSLVAIPIMGISCDANALGPTPTKAELADLAGCESTGIYQPGQGATTAENGAALSVDGSLWWSPSNWRNRIVVPLTFAPVPPPCSITGSSRALNTYGSELMIQATDQWDPGFCEAPTNDFSLSEAPTPEPEARNLLADGAADAALTSFAQPGGYGKPVVNAPIAVTGFTISYAISLPTGDSVTTLKLTPLLLAKLLTQSYVGTRSYGDPALAGNPLNITDDPEFHALNPEIPENTTGNGPQYAESELLSLSSNSDVIEALTSYINDTPAARSFLNGTPDTSMAGEDMTVNPAYKGMSLPVDQWPLLSTYESTGFDSSTTIRPCLGSTPQPLYTLIDAPLTTMEDITEAMQFENANSTMTCKTNTAQTVNSMVATGRQKDGHYFMIGITPLADDSRYNLRSASLETTSGTFVAPSNTTLKAATALVKPDTSSGTWPIPYGTFSTSAGSSAYPGTMLVYAAVPTSGLTAPVAADIATFLKFAATTGQTPGSGVGELPPGYLPMTAGNGLGGLAAYTLAAAADVTAQNGQVPALVAASDSSGGGGGSDGSQASSASTTAAGASSTASDATGGLSGFLGEDGFARGFSRLSSSESAAAADAAKDSKNGHKGGKDLPPIDFTSTADESLWIGSLPVVLLLVLAMFGLVAVPALYRAGRRRGRW